MTPKHLDSQGLDALIEALLSLSDPDECRAFLEDICTVGELCDLAQRYRVALMLSEGKNYQEISRATGASSATVCRVSKCLNYGAGYRAVLNKRAEAEQKETDA